MSKVATVTNAVTPAHIVVVAKPLLLTVKMGGKFGGARAAWYALLVAHNGKAASAYLASATAVPPSLPTKGKSAGKAEKPTGWLAWFVRNGYATIA